MRASNLTTSLSPLPVSKPLRPLRRRVSVIALLAIMSMVIVSERLHTRMEPVECDVATYAEIADGMRHGRPLYSEMFDIKPPALYYTFEIAETAWGNSREMITRLGIFVSILTLIGLYFAGSVAPFGRAGGLLAALIWTIVGCDCLLQANMPNAEVFMNAALIWGFGFCCRRRAAPRLYPVLAGLCFGLATLYKQVAIAPAAIICLGLFLSDLKFSVHKDALRVVSMIMAIVAASWLAMLICFAQSGNLRLVWETLFVYPRIYAKQPHWVPDDAFAPSYVRAFWPLLAIAAIGLPGSWTAPRVRLWTILAAYLIGAEAGVMLPGRYYEHYYQLLMPCLCLAFAWGAVAILNVCRRAIPGKLLIERYSSFKRACGAASDLLRSDAPTPFLKCRLDVTLQGRFASYEILFRSLPFRGRIGAYLVLLVVICTCANEVPYFVLPGSDWTLVKYQDVYSSDQQFALLLSRLLRPGETFYTTGYEPDLYYYAHMRPPVGVLSGTVLYDFPDQGAFARTAVAELSAKPPEIVIDGSFTYNKISPRITRWLRPRYRKVPALAWEPFSVSVRKGGRLDQILESAKRPFIALHESMAPLTSADYE